MSVLRRVGRIIMPLLLPVLALLIINSTVNRHNHLIRGFVYTHAHPYQMDGSASPFQDHNHSILELAILDLLTDIEIIIGIIAVGLSIYLLPKLLKVSIKKLTLIQVRLLSLNPRAPPVLYNY